MFVAISPFSEYLTVSNFTFMVTAFHFFRTTAIRRGDTIFVSHKEGNRFPQTQQNRKRANVQQSNMAYSQELTPCLLPHSSYPCQRIIPLLNAYFPAPFASYLGSKQDSFRLQEFHQHLQQQWRV